VGTTNASMTVQAKFMMKRKKMDVLDLSSDSALIYSMIYAVVFLFNYLLGHPSINLHNFKFMFITSILMTLCGYVG
jgi:hypothetical protein